MTAPEGTSLYRLFDADGRLIYVGIAGNPGRRFEQHAGEKPWWGDVARIALTHYSTRHEAAEAERHAIITEQPVHNIVHNRAVKPAETRIRSERLTIVCTGCREAIADRDGYLLLPLQQVRKVETKTKELEKVAEQNGAEWGVVNQTNFLELLKEYPDRVKWLAWHHRCDPTPDSHCYCIEVERIRTFAQLTDWTGHLMEKPWTQHTDWSDLIKSAGNTHRIDDTRPLRDWSVA